jgi:hypothetical protein
MKTIFYINFFMVLFGFTKLKPKLQPSAVIEGEQNFNRHVLASIGRWWQLGFG